MNPDSDRLRQEDYAAWRAGLEANGYDVIEREPLVVDYATYTKTYFFDCKLVYRGGRPPTMLHCVFDQSEFVFEGPALNTLAYLAALASGSGDEGSQMVLQMLNMPISDEAADDK